MAYNKRAIYTFLFWTFKESYTFANINYACVTDIFFPKLLEVQRELEDIKKTRSDEINRLKIEVEDLKSKADLERVQVCHVSNRLK